MLVAVLDLLLLRVPEFKLRQALEGRCLEFWRRPMDKRRDANLDGPKVWDCVGPAAAWSICCAKHLVAPVVLPITRP